MNALNQTQEITLIKETILASSRKGICNKKTFTFGEWIVCHFRTMVMKRYNTYLVCQTEIDAEDTLYHLNP